MPHQRSLTARRLAAVLTLAALACPAGAQQVFRIVGPDGKVTFSDQPPADPKAKAAAAPVANAGGGSGTASLPFELRQVASRFPVVLYTGPDCPPCGSARSYLSGRGIPFTERTVSTNQDIQALQRLSGSASLPFLTIGGQQLNGYADTEWTQYLNAAGYPATSQLPASYRQAPATPLVAAAAPRPAAPEAPRAPPPAVQVVPVTPPPPGSNPSGIQF